MSYSIRNIGEVVGGRFLQLHHDDEIGQLLLDSRRLIFPATSLFFALAGPRRDGRAFVEELYRRGVRNFVVSEVLETGGMPEANVLLVEDTLAALQGLAGWHRRQYSLPVIGITGSNGKTIVKEWLNQLLEDDYHIVRSPKSYNSQTGVPLSVWGVGPSHELGIFEAGISRRGEMERLEKMIKPTIGIFTTIGEAHSEGFESLSEKAMEKLNLFVDADVLIYNSDQAETEKAVARWRGAAGTGRAELGTRLPGAGGRDGAGGAGGRAGAGGAGGRAGAGGAGGVDRAGGAGDRDGAGGVDRADDAGDRDGADGADGAGERDGADGAGGVAAEPGEGPELFTWGHRDGVTVRIGNKEKKDGWTGIAIRYDGEDLSLSVPFTDDASIEDILHCVCVLLLLNVPADQIKERLARLVPIAMRLELKSGINHCSIINDSYNADLSSLSIALDFLTQQQQHIRRSVILSDILESGREEGELYAEVARALGQKKVDRLIGIGGRIGANASAFGEWFPGEAVFYPSVSEFRRDLHQLHFRDETILIKGARVFEFEQIDRLLTEKIHQTIMEVNLGAMAQNLRQYRQLLQPATRVMAMVKAFGYGSGSYEIANLLQFHGVDYLGVAYADEGVVLRKGGIRMPIMVMNTENSSFDSLVQYNLEPVIYSFSLLRSFDHWLKREGIPAYPVHVELETGMHRLGFPAEELDELVRVLPATAFKVQSVFSHFAASEDPQQDVFTQAQAALYLSAADRLQAVLGYNFIRHISNSAGIVRHPQLQLDMVRLGIGLYGIDSANTHRLDLQEVSTLKTTIAQIKHLREGDTIGYNRRGLAVADMVIATVRIGYADGYVRSLGNGAGKMWINGRLAPTIGVVSMDMTMIDITGIPDAAEGDEVIVFGKELGVSQLAVWAGTIPYEILTSVSQRVKRVYFEE